MHYYGNRKALLIATIAFATGTAWALGLADDLRDLVGYIVVGGETIEDFEGCEWDQRIVFMSGTHVTCKGYGYQYAYLETAVILAQPISVRGRVGFACKMAVSDTLYEVDCSSYMRQQIAVLCRIAHAKSDSAAYARDRLRMLGDETCLP